MWTFHFFNTLHDKLIEVSNFFVLLLEYFKLSFFDFIKEVRVFSLVSLSVSLFIYLVDLDLLQIIIAHFVQLFTEKDLDSFIFTYLLSGL